MATRIPLNEAAIAAFCQRHHIRKLSLFGSVLREDFDPQKSDVDVLVEFETEAERGLTYFKLAQMEFELARLVGRRAEIVLANSLDRYLQNEILSTAEVQYDAA